MKFEAFVVAFCLAIQVQAAPLEARGFSICLPGSLGKIVSGFSNTFSSLFSKWFSKRSDELAYFQVQELLDELENTGLYEGFVTHYVANHPDFAKEFEGCLKSSMRSGDISLNDIYYSMEKQGLFEHFYEKHMKHTKPKLINLFNSEGLKYDVYESKKTESHPHDSYYENKKTEAMNTLSKLMEYGIDAPSEMFDYIVQLLSEAHLTSHVTRSLVERDNGQETVDWLIKYMQTHSADDVLKTIKEANISEKLVDLAMTHSEYWSWALGSSKKVKRGIIGSIWNLVTGGSSGGSSSSVSGSAVSSSTKASSSPGYGTASATSSISLMTGQILTNQILTSGVAYSAAAAAATGAATTSKSATATTTKSTASSTSTSDPTSGTNLVGSIMTIVWDIIKGVVNGTADLSTPSTIGKIILGALRFVINLLSGGGSKSSGSSTMSASTTAYATATSTSSATSATSSSTGNLTLSSLFSSLYKRDYTFGEGYGILGDVIEDLYIREVENGVDLTKKSLEGFPKNRQDLEVFKREMADYFYENLLSEFAKRIGF
ncbi:uncharacterized protein KQ657_000061 [Scheffersomyces spartinae]|uniref:Uncharacterized protein n=1 Tax=Scheffersomyces spartinae TaxID=45513 RepID=A0A9P8AKL5_9ASCO|nr:uncharacterized protein KQ657_000061 [Scheffersomyces spartinae]KAG7196052.1 hypothetical protein KQ657_000061 [Scheffersomyces spartinae]